MSLLSVRQCKIKDLYFWCSVVLVFIGISMPPFRYLVYATFPLGILVFLAEKPIIKKEFSAYYAFICYAVISLLASKNASGVKDILFLLCPLVMAHAVEWNKIKWNVIYALCLGSFFIAFVLGVAEGRGNFSVNIMESQSIFESPFCFLFGLFFLVSIYHRQKWMAIIFLVLIFVTLKRIVLLGLLCCLVLYVLDRGGKYKKYFDILFTCLFVSNLLFILAITYGDLDVFISKTFGVSANHFTMGRQALYEALLYRVDLNDWPTFFGHGVGSSYAKIISISTNLHSDILKIFYEFGLPFFIFFIYALFRFTNGFGRYAVIFTCMLFMTDNVLIYSFYMVFAMLCMLPGKRDVSDHLE